MMNCPKIFLQVGAAMKCFENGIGIKVQCSACFFLVVILLLCENGKKNLL